MHHSCHRTMHGLTLVAVRAIVPVTHMPPNVTEAIFAAPWATSSQLERCLRPVIPSATTADSSDLIAPSKAMATASGRTAPIFLRSKAGSDGAGKDRGIPPKREPMVATSRWNSAAIAAVTATATRKPGHFG